MIDEFALNKHGFGNRFGMEGVSPQDEDVGVFSCLQTAYVILHADDSCGIQRYCTEGGFLAHAVPYGHGRDFQQIASR
jgi:hypothetical protein